MSSSQNLEPSSSSSIRAPYAPFFSKSSTSNLDSCCTYKIYCHIEKKSRFSLLNQTLIALQSSVLDCFAAVANCWPVYPVDTSFAVDVLEDGFIQTQLQTSLVKHLPLVRVTGYQPVHLDSLHLANAVTACLSLEGKQKGRYPGTSRFFFFKQTKS